MIVQKNNPVLRKISPPVPLQEIGGVKLNRVIQSMKKALRAEPDGVAIAAPQIGVSRRIFVVSGRLLGRLANLPEEKIENQPDTVFINPEFKKISKKRLPMEEGCLSVRYLYGNVSRAVQARVVAYDERGKRFERGASGILAQVFQHEIDHLNGLLFIDKAENLREMTPEEWREGIRSSRPAE